MDGKYQFPGRPHTFPGESLRGYMKRVAELLRAEYVTPLLSIAGFDGDATLLNSRADTGSLATALEMTQETLDSMRYKEAADDRGGSILGHSLPRYCIRQDNMHVCRSCLAEAPYHRLVWDLSFVTVCEIHGEPLIDSCPHCQSKLGWNKPGITVCADCGLSIAHHGSRQGNDRVGAALSRILAAARAGSGSGLLADLPQPGSSLKLHDLLNLLVFLGRLRAGADGRDLRPGRTMTYEGIANLLTDGLDALDSWPASFEAFLEDAWVRRQSSSGAMGSFGHIYRRLLREPSDGWGAFGREAFIRFLARHHEIPVMPGKTIGLRVLELRGFLTVDQVRKRLGLKSDQFRALKRSPLWTAAEPVQIGPVTYLRNEAVGQLEWKLASALTMAQLGEMIGIRTKAQLRKIAARGCFRSASPDLCLDGRASYFDRTDVESFMFEIERLDDAGANLGRTTSFNEVSRMACSRGMTLGDVIAFMREGILEPVGKRGSDGIRAVRFDRLSAVRVLDRQAAARLGSVSMREAADAIGVSLMVAYQLAKKGFLTTASGEHPALGLRVDRAELARFVAEFVSAEALTAELGVEIGEVRALLSKRGRRIIDFRGAEVYRRSQLSFLHQAGDEMRVRLVPDRNAA